MVALLGGAGAPCPQGLMSLGGGGGPRVLCRTTLCALCCTALCVVHCSAMCRNLRCTVLCSALHLFVPYRTVPRALCRTAVLCAVVHCDLCCAALRCHLHYALRAVQCAALHCMCFPTLHSACRAALRRDVLFHTAPCHAAHCPVHLRTLCCSAFGAAPPQCANRLTLKSFPTCPT